jgi:hypothetical protein
MIPRLILLNGPPRCGKDTAANMLRMAASDPSVTIGFSYHLKRMVHGIYLGHTGWLLDPNYFDAVKNQPQEFLGGMSWRQAYIHYSESVIKPLHGKEWFGEMFVRFVRESMASIVFVPDSGFREEAERVVREYGADHVKLIRIHREGINFAGDSRSYIDLSDLGVPCFDVENVTGNQPVMRGGLLRACGSWVM